MRKYITILIACLLFPGLAACGTTEAEPVAADVTAATTTEVAAEEDEDIEYPEEDEEEPEEETTQAAAATITTRATTTTAARAARPGEVRLTSVEEAGAFFARRHYTMQEGFDGEPTTLVAVMGDRTRRGNSIFTPYGWYELDPERMEYMFTPGEQQDEPPRTYSGPTLREITTEGNRRREHFELTWEYVGPDGTRRTGGTNTTYVFENGVLVGIGSMGWSETINEDGSRTHIHGHDYFDILFVLDTVDPALFCLEGYTRVDRIATLLFD